MSAAVKEPKTWNKSEEIEFLDKVIKQLGERSYLGPWLKENRNQIAADISNDVCIEIETPYKAYRRGLNIVEAAKVEAAQIVAQGRIQASQEITQAHKRVEDELRAVRLRLHAAVGLL